MVVPVTQGKSMASATTGAPPQKALARDKSGLKAGVIMAAYCQAYGRWVDAEDRLRNSPTFIKTQSGDIQQSHWFSIANKQMELMSRAMSELGLTPAARSRIVAPAVVEAARPICVQRVIVYVTAEALRARQLQDEAKGKLTDDQPHRIQRNYQGGET